MLVTEIPFPVEHIELNVDELPDCGARSAMNSDPNISVVDEPDPADVAVSINGLSLRPQLDWMSYSGTPFMVH